MFLNESRLVFSHSSSSFSFFVERVHSLLHHLATQTNFTGWRNGCSKTLPGYSDDLLKVFDSQAK